MTYSIGFRTPAYQELAEQFLVYLQDRICVDGVYADPDLKLQKHPSEIGPDMLQQVAGAIKQVRWDAEDVANFLGCYLSEPKPHIFFDAPAKPLSALRFAQTLQTQGVTLDMKTQMQCYGNTVFINGDSHQVSKEGYRILRGLADTRTLAAGLKMSHTLSALIHEWYVDGYLAPTTVPRRRS